MSVKAIGTGVIAASLIVGPGLAGAGSSSAAAAVSASAPGGPGTTSYLDVARKDCFGTARNTTSKVWFTVAGGVLSDAYYPTIESSNVKTLQYLVTDGKTFADLQERDMPYTVSAPDRSGMACRVTSTDTRHGFQIVTDYITDPAANSIVMRSRLVPLPGHRSGFADLKVYVRYNPHIDNTGGGGSSNGGANNAEVDPATTALVATDTTPATGPGPFAATVYGAARLPPPARDPAVPRRVRRVRRHPQRRSQPARHQSRAAQPVPVGSRRQRHTDRPGRCGTGSAVHPGARLRAHRRHGY